MTGHCSNCGEVWELEEKQGVCQWCNCSASCQTTWTKPCPSKTVSPLACHHLAVCPEICFKDSRTCL